MPDNGLAASRGVFQARAFEHDVVTLKAYGDTRLKLTALKSARVAGVEVPYTEKNTVNTEKLANNRCRAKGKILEYGYCNPWEYFATMTLSPEKIDRFALKRIMRALPQWLRDERKRTGAPLQYLLIPEKHKSGAWHLHGLLNGLPQGALSPFTLEQHLPYKLRQRLKEGRTIYNWSAYAAKFGYVEIEPLRDRDRAVSYITKYITKDLERSVTELGEHMYYNSKGLQTARLLKRGHLIQEMPFDYQNDYCAIAWFDANEIPPDILENAIQ